MILVDKAYDDIVGQFTISLTMNVQQDSDYNHFFNDYIVSVYVPKCVALFE